MSTDLLYCVTGVKPAPSNPAYGYIHVAESDERFFVTAERLAKERLVEEPRLVERAELLEWKAEASQHYREWKAGPQVTISSLVVNKSDDRYTTVWLTGCAKPLSLHKDVLARAEYASLKLQEGACVPKALLDKAAYDSSIFYKDPKKKGATYGEVEWAKENYRIERTEDLICSWFPEGTLEFTRIGKGAGELEFYDKTTVEGNKEIGLPDILVTCKGTGKSVMLESTGGDFLGKSDSFHLREDTKEKIPGTDRNRYGEFWVRPDKIGYMRRHPETAVYLAFHYANEQLNTTPGEDGKPKVVPPASRGRELFAFVRPDIGKEYAAQDWKNNAKGMSERFVAFFQKDPEFYTSEQFKKALAADLGLEPRQAAKERALER
ncbi:hypothetical protein [Ramlibacter alkalitolerans]|uniref:Uncharacterized protein n=1 Tax=Ramlibacter alkalitolerans TaxID=2039631 RepID=A0ABS1JU73_9BURK|nr:hypothetical protein [Ramlibacter alkalitolerans]MBL0427809.1 hypothetical protein [Ramlibacter alkalitolerans]